MDSSGLSALAFWIVLYLIPIGLLVQNWKSHSQILKAVGRFLATWGALICTLAAACGGAIAGGVGIAGGGIGAALCLVWGSVCYFATRPNQITR